MSDTVGSGRVDCGDDVNEALRHWGMYSDFPDGFVQVAKVLAVLVAMVGFEVRQRPFERLAGIFGTAVDRAALAVVISCSLRVQKLIIGRDLTGVNAMS